MALNRSQRESAKVEREKRGKLLMRARRSPASTACPGTPASWMVAGVATYPSQEVLVPVGAPVPLSRPHQVSRVRHMVVRFHDALCACLRAGLTCAVRGSNPLGVAPDTDQSGFAPPEGVVLALLNPDYRPPANPSNPRASWFLGCARPTPAIPWRFHPPFSARRRPTLCL